MSNSNEIKENIKEEKGGKTKFDEDGNLLKNKQKHSVLPSSLLFLNWQLHCPNVPFFCICR